MSYNFFAFLSRMKYINRWSLMRNTRAENLSEHSLEVAIVAHALCVIRNTYFDGSLCAQRCALIALFHDASETITGDLPTPIKYFNRHIRSAYRQIEDASRDKLVSMLPDALRGEYAALLRADSESDAELILRVKWADKICAYIKCLEEKKAGNHEFDKAALSLRDTIDKIDAPEVDFFVREFLPSYSLTLDEQD